MRVDVKYVSLVTILFFAFCGDVLACDCAKILDEESADIAFIGKLTSQSKWNREVKKEEEDYFIISRITKNTFDVIQMQKGPNLTKIIVESGDGNSDCDVLPLEVGKTYVIYASDYTYFGFQWFVSACGLAKEIPIHERAVK